MHLGNRTFCLLLIAGMLASIPGAVHSADDALHLENYRGEVVILDFWASWCVPCRRSFPWLNSMHAKYAEEGLVIIGVNLDHNKADAETFLSEFPADFQIYYDDDKELARQFDVIAMPSSYIIGRDGEQIKRHLGFKVRLQPEYEAAIIEALKKRGT
jgi:cytochrome c biogenesis protein CcmG/thiol:disulfide interchange protein DsbE